jgi:hypothetical protein
MDPGSSSSDVAEILGMDPRSSSSDAVLIPGMDPSSSDVAEIPGPSFLINK